MISDYGRRWRALRAWFDDFPPDDQERLLGQMAFGKRTCDGFT
jgi:hypothetical protein